MSTIDATPAVAAGLTEGELIAVALFGVGGVVATWWGVRTFTDGYEIWSHDPVDAAAVADAAGVVEVTGTARPLDETVVAPYTNTECLAHEYRTQVEERDHGDEDGGTEWRTVERGSDEVPFVVTDDSGSVAVDPSGAELSMDDEDLDDGPNRRRTERRLDVDETVHVYGHRRDDGLGDEPVYVGDGDAVNFRIADTTAGRAVGRLLAKGAVALVAGVVCFGIAGLVATGAA
ncbi:GIDE domain-containing protein [Halobacterium yunchengense]|uniref:GIDE domain-containing protein n=1 Tax=Halobacterium yunchengense TaxID=3108497 RepID=UPI003009D22E